jgi:hypothetical protein
MKFSSKEESKRRLVICSGCEHLYKTTYTCKVCGCFMRVKATIESSKCPKNKW